MEVLYGYSFNASQEVYMSNAKKSHSTAPARASRCTSLITPDSSSGATTTLLGSSIPSFMPASSAKAMRFGETEAQAPARTAATLRNHVADEQFPARVASIAAQVAAATEQQAVHALFREGVAALGASSAVFVSFVRDEHHVAAYRFMLACDPAWSRVYVQDGHFAHDPWLAYAAQHSEPVVASALNVIDAEHRRVLDRATSAGFVSTVLIPAHSAAGHSRVSVLLLGSSTPGYFEGAGLAQLRVNARMLALELHDWWLARVRRDLIVKARIKPDDLVLLQYQSQGHSSKKIAAALGVSRQSINSRFQRMNAKLGVGNRRMAVQLAIECGLLLK